MNGPLHVDATPFVFFFQAEDGIRDRNVTGVQTCALPISNVSLALGVMVTPSYARLVRANAMSFAQREFVTAARSLGAGEIRIMLREVTPNILQAVFSYSFMMIAVLIVAEASLSYLGLSIPRPEPTWGNMIAAGQSDFQTYPFLVGVPGVVLFLTVLSLNQVGEAAGRKWNPTAAKI